MKLLWTHSLHHSHMINISLEFITSPTSDQILAWLDLVQKGRIQRDSLALIRTRLHPKRAYQRASIRGLTICLYQSFAFDFPGYVHSLWILNSHDACGRDILAPKTYLTNAINPREAYCGEFTPFLTRSNLYKGFIHSRDFLWCILGGMNILNLFL